MPYPSEFKLTPTPRWVRWALYWAGFTTIALLNAASTIVANPEIAPWKPFVWELSSLWTVGLVYPLVAFFVRRFPLSKRPRVLTLVLHVMFLLAFSAVHTSGMVAIRKIVYLILGQTYTFGGGTRVLYEFYKDLILYPLLVGLTAGIDYYRKFRENELRSEQLQRRLAEAQLQNLRGQLNPHFLFNTLNMISARMYEDVSDADRMITRLSDLLRMALEKSSDLEVPLRTELEMLELYLEIMKGRLQDSIQVRMEIDPRSENAIVPTLLLQPLVENAFRHGVSGRTDGGCIEIFGSTKNGTVFLTVRDNGLGIPGGPEAVLKKGIGLSNTAERLRQLYGSQHQMHIRNRPSADGGGLEVTIEVPARFSD